MKPDNCIRNICISAIKRHTIAPYDFLLTRFFEQEFWHEIINETPQRLSIAESELPISMVFIDGENFSVITTRQIITSQNGIIKTIEPNKIIDDVQALTAIKEHKGSFTISQLILSNNEIFEIFIETGRASMVMIYTLRTLRGQLSAKNTIK